MIVFASALPTIEEAAGIPWSEIKDALHASLYAVLAAGNWDSATAIRVVMTEREPGDWIASLTCDNPARGFETALIQPDKYCQGTAQRIQAICVEARRRGLTELISTFIPSRVDDTGHELLEYSIEAEKWDSNPR